MAADIVTEAVVEVATPKAATDGRMDLELMQVNANRASALMKLLGHPHRLMILCELNQGECSVGDLGERIGINQSPLSQHLARMRHEGVVESRREAQTVFYSLAGEEVVAVVSLLYDLYCRPGTTLGASLGEGSLGQAGL